MAKQKFKCAECNELFSESRILFLEVNGRNKIICLTCRNENLYPGGTRDGEWYQRFLSKIKGKVYLDSLKKRGRIES